ncbi:hypothetical protein AB0G15_05430 [Streptosporangium sp. NPDC023825]|uniref:hypothetical protein n=1 Tax=Streptosporangium sp. NPDC023825 TaxID=3154909 RepID=UPI00343E3F98
MYTLGFETVQLVGLMVNVILPILVDLVSKASWSGGAKATIHAFLTAVIGFGSTAIAAISAGVVFDWREALLLAVSGWFISTAAYFKAWRHTTGQAVVLSTFIKDKPKKYDLAA